MAATGAALDVPEYKQLQDVYEASDVETVEQRYRALAGAFEAEFGCKPTLFARAPGRVNLIGEHIDYEGYGVLPMAVALDTIVAIARGGDDLHIRNVATDKYAPTHFSPSPTQKVDTDKHSWANYFLAAYLGVHTHATSAGVTMPVTGLQVMVDGTVPTGGGLSSSSALVVASAIAILAVHDLPRAQADVAAFTCIAERLVGVSSGGMDQAISVMGQRGHAAYIQFDPVRATPVPLPVGGAFVIANSLAVSNKAETAAGRYNLRVVECRLAAAMLAIALGVPAAQARALKTLREAEQLVAERTNFSSQGAADGLDSENMPEDAKAALASVALLEHCSKVAHDKLEAEPYMAEQLESQLGMRLDDFFEHSKASLASLAWAASHGGFHLRARAQHVFSEAARVLRFQAVCAGAGSHESKLNAIAELMDASHDSCNELYDCSCSALEQLRAAAKDAGAMGSRLTGAGWGGCTVSLIREADVDKFMAAVKAAYYEPGLADGRLASMFGPTTMFATKPSSGAAVLRLTF